MSEWRHTGPREESWDTTVDGVSLSVQRAMVRFYWRASATRDIGESEYISAGREGFAAGEEAARAAAEAAVPRVLAALALLRGEVSSG